MQAHPISKFALPLVIAVATVSTLPSCKEQPAPKASVLNPFDSNKASQPTAQNGLELRLLPMTEEYKAEFSNDQEIFFLAEFRNVSDKTIQLYGLTWEPAKTINLTDQNAGSSWTARFQPELDTTQKQQHIHQIEPGEKVTGGIKLDAQYQYFHTESAQLKPQLSPSRYSLTATWDFEDTGAENCWIGKISSQPFEFTLKK